MVSEAARWKDNQFFVGSIVQLHGFGFRSKKVQGSMFKLKSWITDNSLQRTDQTLTFQMANFSDIRDPCTN